MKRKTTKETLAESFQEIAAVKKANKITVSDIVRNCGMSPATFYRHFRDKYDLIAWIYEQWCEEIFHRFDGRPDRKEQIYAAWVRLCWEKKEFLKNLIENTDGYDSFILRMVEVDVRLIENDIVFLGGRDALTEKVHLKIYLYSAGMARLMSAWLLGRITAEPDEITEVLLEMIPVSVAPLITPRYTSSEHKM